MFEKAARLKLRFESSKGLLTAEDLWDLPLTSKSDRPNLDDIARGLHNQIKNSEDVSFVKKEQKGDSVLQLKFDVIKHVIDIKVAEDEARDKARENAAKRQRIMQIIAERKDQEMMEKPLEELEKLLGELGQS
jgi:hypothetical protein